MESIISIPVRIWFTACEMNILLFGLLSIGIGITVGIIARLYELLRKHTMSKCVRSTNEQLK